MALNEYADNSNGWIMSSFVPGKTTGTPYQSLYECLGNAEDEAQDCALRFFITSSVVSSWIASMKSGTHSPKPTRRTVHCTGARGNWRTQYL